MLQMAVPAPMRDLKHLQLRPIAPERPLRGLGCCALVGDVMRSFMNGVQRGAGVTSKTSNVQLSGWNGAQRQFEDDGVPAGGDLHELPDGISARSVAVRFKGVNEERSHICRLPQICHRP